MKIFLSSLCAVVLSFLIPGCEPRTSVSIESIPDETVGFLTLDDAGEIQHENGSFQKLVNRSDQKLVVVDCWAAWCGPCRMLAPHLDAIKKKWGDRIEIVKVDVDASAKVAGALGVSSIPDVRIFRNGKQISDFVGLWPREEIESLLKSLE